MLAKIALQGERELEAIHPAEEDPQPVNLEREYSAFTLFQRLLVFLRSLFTPLNRLEIVEDLVMRRIAREVEEKYPGIYTYQSGTVNLPFLEEIKRLTASMKIIGVPISRLTQEKREELFGLILFQELPELAARIEDRCRPERINEALQGAGEKELVREMVNQLEDLFDQQLPEERARLREDARALNLLHELVYFPFDTIKGRFNTSKEEGCAASEIKDQLKSLTALFQSMNTPFSTGLLESLYLVTGADNQESSPREIVDSLAAYMKEAQNYLSMLRNFYRSVPLYNLARLSAGKVNLFLRPAASGDQWRSYCTSFYRKRFRNAAQRMLIGREFDTIMEEAKELLQSGTILKLPYYRREDHSQEIIFRYESSVAFLLRYLELLFSIKLNPPLKQVLIDGEFYKEQNSEDYSEAYNGLQLLGDGLRDLSEFLGPAGDGGRKLAAISSEIVPAASRQRKAAQVASEADEKAAAQLKQGVELLGLLSAVLKGILYGEKGGRFDTLSNLGYIGGRSNQQLLGELKSCYLSIEGAVKVLTTLISLEDRYHAAG